MKILVTGVAGFIGFNLSKLLLENNYEVIGIDNFNNYYDVKLKKKRILILKSYKKFKLNNFDLCNFDKISTVYKKNKFQYVFHLAAQAGVRYSIQNPSIYLKYNIDAFFNILELSKIHKIKRLFYASSSSVYGENKNFPLEEEEKINPKNFYGLTKKMNEQMAKVYNLNYGLRSIGLRFFTVFGEYGRPDMMIMKFLYSFFNKKYFNLYNFGNHSRDFTYINDVVNILIKLLKKEKKINNYEIFNICSNSPVDLKKVIKIFKSNNIKPKIKNKPLQLADIHKTHGSNKKILNEINFKKFTPFPIAMLNTIKWYRNYYKIKK